MTTFVVGEKAADGANVQRWFDCPGCGYEARSKIVSTLQNAAKPQDVQRSRFLGQEGWPESHGPDPQMSLDVIDRHSEALFEFLWCPVCGHEVFSHIPSRACSASTASTQVELQEPQEGPWLRGSCPRLLRYRHDLESPRRRKSFGATCPDGSAG